MSDLANRRFAILGATGGVGAQLARDLRERGAGLVLLARDEERLAQLAAELDSPHATLPAIDAGTVHETLVQACGDQPIDGVAHCVGSLLLKPARRTTAEEWNAVLETNLSSAFGVTMAANDVCKGGGSIVFCSSTAATVGVANHEAIAAAKAGLIGLMNAAAASHARRRIRFHCVAPGLVDSPLTANLLERAGMREAAAKQNPSGRIGTPGDVARAIAFLLDPANDWVDAQVLNVDGGFAAIK